MSEIQTYTGQAFDVINPDVNKINIEDIAHSLSLQCRFGGHCREFYSVAQHSVLVSQYVSKKNAMWGLLHDASEAYITDIPWPIKSQMIEFERWEDKLHVYVGVAFGLNIHHGNTIYPKEVRNIDKALLATEELQIMKQHIKWEHNFKPIEGLSIKPVGWKKAKKMFLERYQECLKLR